MAQIFYLTSGHTSTGGLEEINREALESSSGVGNVLVLSLASEDPGKIQERAFWFGDYFMELGANNVQFVTPDSTERDVWERFGSADLIYLPGGNTNIGKLDFRALTYLIIY